MKFVFLIKKKCFLEESSRDVEMMHVLLLSRVLLVPTLRFMTAYVALGVIADDGTEFNVMPVDYVSHGLVYLSRQQSSLGKIFYFANQHAVPVREVFTWLEKFGYPLETVSFQEWRERALNVEQTNALYSVAPLYREQTEYPEFKIDCTNTLAALQDSGIVCPRINEEHIQTCLAYLIDIGFLEAPQVQEVHPPKVEIGD